MQTDAVSEQTSLRDRTERPEQEDPANTTSHTREAVNLRLVLELRRRLKSAAEKELAIASDRMRALLLPVPYLPHGPRPWSCSRLPPLVMAFAWQATFGR